MCSSQDLALSNNECLDPGSDKGTSCISMYGCTSVPCKGIGSQ